ncbi:MAG: winged helix-turn-helix domain-containing protein, partial [Peptostreptococcaceae bacterium]|nr:winged helix-turn-helix domain-containing protein [Peptostreptococcaceae bacterium]
NIEESNSITLTHQEIADHISTAREVVSRMLKYFANEGLVKVSRKGIEIINREKIQEKTE